MSQQNELPKAILNEAGLATQAGWLTVYSIESVQREYQQSIEEYFPEGVGLPALSYADKPPAPKKGWAIIRSVDGSEWQLVSDYRGQTVYNTENGQPETVTTLGPLAAGFTLLAPATPYDSWDGEAWVTDTAAQHSAAVNFAQGEMAQRQRTATEQITILSDAVALDMATEREKELLLEWKKYRVLLARVDVSVAPDVAWPKLPS